MSCGSDFQTGSCVCDTLAAIADAQQDNTQDCISSCSESVRELMGGTAPTNFNTVPVQLICNSTNPLTATAAQMGGFCGTVFIAQGYRRNPATPNTLIGATASFFRVSSVDPDTCCAVLELLCVTGLSFGPNPANLEACTGVNTPVYTRTGICITIDTRCFCGVSCLPAASICPAS
ncbi:CotY/CotZ family spore coat protein [Metabacillus sp. RGM 3146]|uniref:CotY/CotZ family spore coat protein n=1 Tax=Metabacillus sp. RGM 3146 TaxID=3401092 RepID=UPI003B98EF14